MTDRANIVKRFELALEKFHGAYADAYADAEDRGDARRALSKARESLIAAMANGWQPIETAPKHEEVLVWREDAGVLLSVYTYCADQGWLSDKEQDEMDEETLFKEDWWWFGPHGVCRMEGSEVPTHWMPLPPPPAV